MEIKNVSFSYGNDFGLNDVSFKIPEGKITTILGANGSGKTTLLKVMTKALKPSNGTITLGGKNISGISLHDFAKQVAVVQQYNSAPKDMKVKEIVSFGRTPHIERFKGQTAKDLKIVNWAMEAVDVKKYSDRVSSTLSGGQLQRVWLGMSLAQKSKVLFLDEPSTHLDIKYQIKILNLIKKLNRDFGTTIVIILHDINQAIHYSDYLIGLNNGEKVLQGEPREIISSENLKKIYDIDLKVIKDGDDSFVLSH